MAIAGIAFDAFGTLFDLAGLQVTAREAADELGADPEELEWLAGELPGRLIPLTWHATVAADYRPLPEMAALALRSGALQRGLELDDEEASRLAGGLSKLPAFADVRATLDALAPTPLAILSNGTREGVEALAARAGIADRFEHLLVADQVRRYKPAREVYELASDAFRCEPASVLLVSGNEWDVAGAKLAGLSAAWIARGRRTSRFLGVGPDLVCDELVDLPAAVRRG